MKEKKVINCVHDKPISSVIKLFSLIMRIMRIKTMMERDLSRKKMIHRADSLPKKISKKFKVEVSEIDGYRLFDLAPLKNPGEKTVLYLHGGAYIYGLQKMHWNFISELISKTRCRVLVPDYPLAPENTVDTVYEFIFRAYLRALEDYDHSKLIFMGDSAGAGLALELAQRLRDEKEVLPEKLILLSPWFDVTMSNEDIDAIDKYDVVLSKKGLQMAGKAYAGKYALTDPRICPLYGEFHDLPEISIFTGTHDILHPDARGLHDKLKKSGLSSRYYLYKELFHDWMIIAPQADESKKVIEQISELIF